MGRGDGGEKRDYGREGRQDGGWEEEKRARFVLMVMPDGGAGKRWSGQLLDPAEC